MPKMIAGETEGWMDATVYLDGEKVDGCIVADTDAGLVICDVGERINGAWQPTICTCAACGNEHSQRIRRHGVVEIRMT
jgi:hypothetical protein